MDDYPAHGPVVSLDWLRGHATRTVVTLEFMFDDVFGRIYVNVAHQSGGPKSASRIASSSLSQDQIPSFSL
jgi:hypothetical protein